MPAGTMNRRPEIRVFSYGQTDRLSEMIGQPCEVIYPVMQHVAASTCARAWTRRFDALRRVRHRRHNDLTVDGGGIRTTQIGQHDPAALRPPPRRRMQHRNAVERTTNQTDQPRSDAVRIIDHRPAHPPTHDRGIDQPQPEALDRNVRQHGTRGRQLRTM